MCVYVDGGFNARCNYSVNKTALDFYFLCGAVYARNILSIAHESAPRVCVVSINLADYRV